MKLSYAGSSNRAMTLFEVFLVVAILMFLAVLLLPALSQQRTPKARAQRISCINNLKQVGLAYRVWEGDHNDKYPMMVSVTNGGTMELIGTDPEFVRDTFLVMSNELSTPKILHCPADNRNAANSFSPAFTSTNISYFIGVDATDSQPQMVLSGDDNFTVNGTPTHSGLLSLPTNSVVAWTQDRHVKAGNIGLADGSAQQLTILGLQQAFVSTGFATNRLALP